MISFYFFHALRNTGSHDGMNRGTRESWGQMCTPTPHDTFTATIRAAVFRHGFLDRKAQCASGWSEIMLMNRNSRLSSEAVQSVNIKLPVLQHSLRLSAKPEGLHILSPISLSLIECQIPGITWSRGLTGILSSKSQTFFPHIHRVFFFFFLKAKELVSERNFNLCIFLFVQAHNSMTCSLSSQSAMLLDFFSLTGVGGIHT